MRKFQDPIIVKNYELALGILIPAYDWQTGMLFLAKKGDDSILHIGVERNDFVTYSKYSGKYSSFSMNAIHVSGGPF